MPVASKLYSLTLEIFLPGIFRGNTLVDHLFWSLVLLAIHISALRFSFFPSKAMKEHSVIPKLQINSDKQSIKQTTIAKRRTNISKKEMINLVTFFRFPPFFPPPFFFFCKKINYTLKHIDLKCYSNHQ